MTTFFFTTRYGGTQTVTVDLPDAEGVALREAVVATGDWFKEVRDEFQPGQQWELEVADEQKKPLYVLRIEVTKS